MNEPGGEHFVNILDTPTPLDLKSFDAEDSSEEQPDPPLQREGLPRGFRMRHDAHYVDELMSRSPRASTADLTSRLSAADPDVPAAGDSLVTAGSGATFDLLAAYAESAVAHGALAAGHGSGADASAFLQLEFARIARLARAAATLHGDTPPVRRRVGAGDIAAGIDSAAAPVLRAAGFEHDVAVDDPRFTIVGERALILQSVLQVVDGILELAPSAAEERGDRDGVPRVSIHLRCVKPRPALIIEIACATLSTPDQREERFFDNDESDFGSAPAAGLLMAAAAQSARAHGGRAEMKRHNHRGATITLVFPQV